MDEYIDNGYIPNINMIATYEIDDNSVNLRYVESLIEQFLLWDIDCRLSSYRSYVAGDSQRTHESTEHLKYQYLVRAIYALS